MYSFVIYISVISSGIFHMVAGQQSVTQPQNGTRSGNGGLTYIQMMHEFKKEDAKTKVTSSSAYAYIETCKTSIINGNIKMPYKERKSHWMSRAVCSQQTAIQCDRNSPYRTIDGTCNNLRNPEFGKSFIPQNRFLPAAFDDGFDSPRTRSKSGGALPSARTISNNIFKQKNDNFDNRLTVMVMSWGQFNEHDVVFTPTTTMDEQGNLIFCCNQTAPSRPECFPIRIPSGDPFFKTTCMEFIRSSPVVRDPCGPCKPREVINELTSYIDASNVYGSTKELNDKLRLFRKGLLLESSGRLLPPREDQTSCVLTEPTNFCFLAGDKRVQEVPTLGSIHITFVRYHNDIALKLGKINPHWDDEKIFQVTRKILGAIMQKITYKEYLPVVLNKDFRRKFCLNSNCQIYDEKADPATVNSFAVTAFRFGHSQIPPFSAFFKQLSRCPYAAKKCRKFRIKEVERFPTETTFKNPNLNFRNADGLQLFQVTNVSTKSDREFDDSIRDKLFLDQNMDSLDLASLDIQRGRDHGVPSYTKFREFCGLSKIIFFYAGKHGLVDHDPKTIELLRKTYRDVEDIDLFVGGMTERPLPGSEIGPTFNCIMAKQFQLYKIADRFWWERRDPVVGFSSGQLRALKRLLFSKILCDVHNLSSIQPFVMLVPTIKWNRPRKCNSLRPLDLEPWRERKQYRRNYRYWL